ncbi:MAG: 1-aminocyclopropane-1-carboxylate deaminase [Rickettsiales bacterium]|nr:1-aminocyclopropane-1-carboxylate deaminase [Rickettsiales bacterium]|tara:strand:+ start:60 stop:1226 length:1167 start_codon:yes stop_codon:yes gene_type:complete
MKNNNFYLPSKRSEVETFNVMRLLSEANKLQENGRKIYHLELGEPQSKTPILIREEVNRLLRSDLPGYTPSNGIEELRIKISKFYKERYGLDLNHKQIFVTTGSSGAFLLTFLTCFDAGDKVAIFNPVYPAYRNILKSLNINVIEIGSDKNKLNYIDLQKIEKHIDIDGLIISNPNNPNGQVFDEYELRYIYSFCEKNKIKLISDEIYHGIEYQQRSKSILNFGENAIVINSFSKYFCMPGWRLGWAIVSNPLVENFLRLSQNLFISSGNIAQYSALKIFDCIDDLNLIVDNYEKTKESIFNKLSNLRMIKFDKPKGSFYYYIDISDLNINSVEFTQTILQETGVVLTPGIDFDQKNGHKSFRLAFSINSQTAKEGTNKLAQWLLSNY